MVVSVDTTKDETVIPSRKAYDSKVVGVVKSFDDRGFVIGGKGRDYLTLAGRIKLLVTGQNGPIHRGDLIATSDVKGYGMLATAQELGHLRHRPRKL
jgi:hypothetical protein